MLTKVLEPIELHGSSGWEEILSYAAIWFLIFCCCEPVFLCLLPKSYTYWTAKERRQWDANTIGILFAMIAGPSGLFYYYHPSVAVESGDMFGAMIPGSNYWLFTFATGYFLYDTVISLLYYDTSMVVHGFFCFFVYFFAQHPAPFMHSILSFTLAYELSTVFLNLRAHLLQLRMGSTTTFIAVQTTFAIVFLIVRIFFGIPIIGQWLLDILEMFQLNRLHGYSIPAFYLVACVVLNTLNIFWAYKIVTGLFKKRGKKRESEKQQGLSKTGKPTTSVSAVVAAVEEGTLAAVESAVIAAHAMESAVSTAAAGACAAVVDQ
jgi:hypothetical protein